MTAAGRYQNGLRQIKNNAALFARIEKATGVPPPVVAALWGLESDYGAYKGANFPIIRAVHVHKTYRTGSVKVEALRGIDFSVARGEMVAIMGPSGCGKTTLLNCLSGLDEVDEGQILLEGHDLATMSDRARTRYRALRMGFVFQVFNLLPVLTAVENVELPLLVAGIRPGVARQKAIAALAKVGLAEWASHRPAELSGVLVIQPGVAANALAEQHIAASVGEHRLAERPGFERHHGQALIV